MIILYCFSHSHLPGVPLAYFNSFLCPVQPPASRIHACEQDQPTILQSAEWVAFQAACEQAAVELTQSLDNFDRSRMKGYLLGEEKKSVQDYMRAGSEQVQVVCQIIKEITSHPTEGNWQRLQPALEKLTEISAMAAPSPASPVSEINTSPPTAGLARAWVEVQYFLGPIIVTGWSVLSKLEMLTETLTKDIPIVGGLASLMLTLYQRIVVRINQLKTEDQDQLIAVCHALTAAFDKMKGNQMWYQVEANTAATAQAAETTASEANEAKKGIIVLRQENERLTELVNLSSLKWQNKTRN